MKSLLDLIKLVYGPKAISSTIGTRTNVIRLPSGNLQKYLSKELDIESASTNAAKNAYLEMYDLIPEVAKMNDGERLVFEGNLRRLKNKLEDSGLLQGENVSSGITAIQSKIDKLKIKRRELEKATGEKATLTDVLNDLGASQQSMSRLNDEGLVRAAARQILINDIKAGKIKNITVSEAINMGEPLDPFRQIYGEGALEQLDSLIPNSCSAFLPSSIDVDPGNLFSSGSNLNLDLANFSASTSVFKPLRFGIKLSNCSKAPSP